MIFLGRASDHQSVFVSFSRIQRKTTRRMQYCATNHRYFEVILKKVYLTRQSKAIRMESRPFFVFVCVSTTSEKGKMTNDSVQLQCSKRWKRVLSNLSVTFSDFLFAIDFYFYIFLKNASSRSTKSLLRNPRPTYAFESEP